MPSITTINPETGTICGQYPLMDEDEVGQIIQAMQPTQKAWSQHSIATRRQCFIRLAQLLLDNKLAYANQITTEMGKPITQAIAEIEKCARLCSYYVTHADSFLKPQVIETEFHKSYRSFQPLGILFAIMPWNFPFWQVFRFVVPNLIAGNACVLKHAPNTTGAALLIEQLFVEAGFPKHVLRSLIMDVSVAPFVIQHPLIMGVTLTGSNRAGKSVAGIAGAALKKVVLELGGNDPYIILEDADLEQAAQQCIVSRLSNAGQVCIAAKRIIVLESIKSQFEALLVEKAKAYVVGSPQDTKTLLGPMAREDLRETLHSQVTRCIASGAKCLLGGSIPEGRGYYYPATVLTDVPIDSPAFCEELFGPVVCIFSAKDEEEAIQLANQSEYGLGGAVFTSNLEKGEHIARDRMQSGTCTVNTMVASDPRMPFGGIKQSGYGRELSVEGIHEFMNIKTVVVVK